MNKIAFLFPGQGSQCIGMGKDLCDRFSVAKQTFEEANEALDFDLMRLCFEGGMDELTKTENTQPAILTASVAAFRVYMEEIGISPAYTAGHSLGEISALCCAGAIKFWDAVRIVRQRGRFMQEAVPVGYGSMAAVSGFDKAAIEDECSKASKDGQIVVVSNYNSPEQIVISGNTGAVANAGEMLKSMGARIIPLRVSAPFHSPLMKPAAEMFEEELMKYTLGDMMWPVISNVTAEPYPSSDKIITYLALQIVSPVKWQSSMEYLIKMGVDTAVEMGPQAVLKNLMKKNAPLITTYSFENDEDLKVLNKKFSSRNQKDVETVSSGLDLITKCIAATVCTKNSNWDDDQYQKGVVEPYKKLVDMKTEIKKLGVEPKVEQIREAVELLKQIFSTKMLPAKEQMERFNQIFEETGTRDIFEDFTLVG